ncbi:aldo/keto reductase [Curtobacterium herbarum]|uniref:Aldo/keto reductase n=1 Tax=Curtobacterium herbarum TaxID=150122 RepID=A0ABN1ZBJ1_9MICO|nr:aldo/keto reductase [Curtobacterium herbarum]MBM7473946.1 putative oxidoreductase [Curtobacterium herbarum]MCS6544727.1 aldo/keto reductase [Curtobacterium herbarum]
MKTLELPQTDLTASDVVVGLMRINDMSDEDIRSLYAASRDAGVTMFDHAAVYGGWHGCEERFAAAVALTPAERAEIVLQTKVGIRPTAGGAYFDFSYEHILSSVEESLAALRTDYIDVLLLHRPDALVEPEEVAKAFDELHAAGKVHHFGVSNHTPGQVELLKKSVQQPLAFNQVQLSITHANVITQGLVANMGGLDQAVDRDNDILNYSRLNDVTLQAWSPFQKGFFDGVFLGDREQYAELNDVLEELASAHGVTPTGIAVAWITRHPAHFQVVLGTTNPQRVRDSAAGSDVELSREEWYRVLTAAGHTVP